MTDKACEHEANDWPGDIPDEDCQHGIPWWECEECPRPDMDMLLDYEARKQHRPFEDV